MPSSISPSSRRIPWTLVGLVATAVLAYGLAACYTVRKNPEIQFFLQAARLKQAWAHKMSGEPGGKVVLFGGSSCAFSIDAERLWRRHGLPAVNLGLGAGMGATVLSRVALDQTRPGDTVVAALEPGLLFDSPEPPMLGVQFSLAAGRPDWLDDLGGRTHFSRLRAALDLRPGGYHCFTLLGKLAGGSPLYRYQVSEFNPSGWQQSPLRWPVSPTPAPASELPMASGIFLTDLAAWARAHRVTLYYSLPWGYVPAEGQAPLQAANAAFLYAVSEQVPVLEDPVLGAYTNRSQFADTAWHLTEEAAHRRTDELAHQLKTGRVWSREELRSRARH